MKIYLVFIMFGLDFGLSKGEGRVKRYIRTVLLPNLRTQAEVAAGKVHAGWGHFKATVFRTVVVPGKRWAKQAAKSAVSAVLM